MRPQEPYLLGRPAFKTRAVYSSSSRKRAQVAADGGWPVYSMRPHEPYLLGRPAAAAAGTEAVHDSSLTT
jgi:hypothetical protein